MARGLTWAAVIAVVAMGCDTTEGPAPLPPPVAPAPPPAPPAPAPAPPPPAAAPVDPKPPPPPEPEPSRITVQHVLIAFKGAHMAPPTVTRTQEEARAFALEILERVRKGEDIQKLAKEYSTDPGGGLYTLVNSGVKQVEPTDIPRGKFIPPFTKVAFKLKVGEAGLAEYNAKTCPYGWHIIKRLE